MQFLDADTTYYNVIKAIGDLWPLLLVLTLIAFLIIYRKEIGIYFKTFKKSSIKIAGNEIQIEREQTSSTQTILVSDSSSSKSLDKTAEENKTSDVIEKKLDLYQVYTLISERKFYEAEKSFKQLQEEVTDLKEKTQNEIYYLYYQYIYGGRDVMGEFLTKASAISDETLRGLAYYYIAVCLEKANRYAEAITNYNEAIKYEKNEDEKNNIHVRIGNNIYSSQSFEEATTYLYSQLNSFHTDSSRSRIYSGLAELYEKRGDLESRFFCLLQSYKYNPNNTSKIFDLAYLLGLSDFSLNNHVLSMYLYNTLLQFNPNDSTALNNIGIEFQGLNLNGEGVKAFKLSMEKGETLAYSNLANQYIDIGAYEEAKALLQEAMKLKNPHQNVFYYLNALAQKEKNEKDSKEKLLQEGNQQLIYMFRLSSGFRTSLTTPFNYNNKFLADKSGFEVQDIVDSEKKRFIWKHGSDEFSFVLKFDTSIVCLTEGVNTYSRSTYYTPTRKIKVYATITESSKTIEVLLIEEEVKKQYFLTITYEEA